MSKEREDLEKVKTSVDGEELVDDTWLKRHANMDKHGDNLESYLTIILFVLKVSNTSIFSWYVVWAPLVLGTIIRAILIGVECKKLKKQGNYTTSKGLKASEYIDKLMVVDVIDAVFLSSLIVYAFGIYRNTTTMIVVTIVFIINAILNKNKSKVGNKYRKQAKY